MSLGRITNHLVFGTGQDGSGPVGLTWIILMLPTKGAWSAGISVFFQDEVLIYNLFFWLGRR